MNTAYQLGYTSSALTKEASWDILIRGSLVLAWLSVEKKNMFYNVIYSGQKPISHDWQAIAINRECHIPLSNVIGQLTLNTTQDQHLW